MTSICAQGISITNIRCSGGAAALTAQLRAIYGTDLIGLWIGEDIVVDGSNNVTSWPGRVGGALAPTSATLYTKATVSGRTAIANTVSAGVVGYTATLSVLPKALFTVAAPTTLPFGNYNTAIWRGDNGLYLFGNSSTSEWYTVGAIYRNGATGISVGSGSNIYEADLASGSNNAIYVGTQTQVVGRSWLGTISFAMAIAAVPTALQRLQTQLALDIYYRPAVAPAAQLALDLYNLFTTTLAGLWVGEDMTLSGTDVISWPGRLGPVLPPIKAGVYRTVSTIGIRKASIAAADEWRGYGATTAVAKAFVSIAKVPTLPFAEIAQCVGTGADNHAIAGNVGTSGLVTGAGWTHYVNGIAAEAVTGLAGTIAHLEGDNASSASAGTRVGCSVLGTPTGRVWPSEIGAVVALSDVPTGSKRIKANALLSSYYSLTLSAPAQLALDLANLFGADITGLWIGDDIVLTGSDLASWPGRAGPTLAATGTYLTQQVGGRLYTRANNATDAHYLSVTVSAAPLSFIAVASVPTIIGDGSSLVGLPGGAMLANNPASGEWFTTYGWSHYRNGVSDETCVATTPAVFEADIATQVAVALEIAGRNSGASRSWTTDFGFMLALSAPPSAGNRAAAVALLRAYYGI